jgi:hypothetical protein
MNRSIATALFGALCLFFIWQAIHTFAPIKFRGTYPILSEERASQQLAQYRDRAKICNSLPECFRPLTAWVILAVHYSVSRAIVSLGKFPEKLGIHLGKYTYYKSINFEAFPVSAASQIVLTTAYVSSFFLLIYQFPGFLGYLSALGLGLVPFMGFVGLTEDDGLKMLYWSCFILFFSRLGLDQRRTSDSKNWRLRHFLIGAVWGAIGSALMENTGIAASIALFALATVSYFNQNGRSSWWSVYAGATVGTLSVLGLIWWAAHRHTEVLWPEASNNMTSVWDVFSQHDKLSLLLEFSYRLLMFPTILAIIALLLAVRLRSRKVSDRNYQTLWVSVAALFGFFCTAVAGLWLGAGFRGEWPRQLMPLAISFSWAFAAGINSIFPHSKKEDN